MVCKKAPGRIARHQVLNDIIWRFLGSVLWDATVVSTLAQSYVGRADTGVGMVAELEAERKLMKYSNLPTNLILQPIPVENLGAFSSSSSDFISALGHKISSVSGKEGETSFLFHRLWHCNDSMQFFCTTPSCPRTIRTNSHSSTVFIAFDRWELHVYTQGYKNKINK